MKEKADLKQHKKTIKYLELNLGTIQNTCEEKQVFVASQINIKGKNSDTMFLDQTIVIKFL